MSDPQPKKLRNLNIATLLLLLIPGIFVLMGTRTSTLRIALLVVLLAIVSYQLVRIFKLENQLVAMPVKSYLSRWSKMFLMTFGVYAGVLATSFTLRAIEDGLTVWNIAIAGLAMLAAMYIFFGTPGERRIGLK